jgi:nucleotide-binding universal stress UspA family protein
LIGTNLFSLPKKDRDIVTKKKKIMKQEELGDLTKILLAIDGSEISRNTTSIAIQIAQILSIEIFGLYVIDEELVMNDYADYGKELGINEPSFSRGDRAALFEKRAQEVLQWLTSKCQGSSVGVATEIGLGGVTEMILNQAQKASIMAIGRRGNGHHDSSDYLGKNFRHIAHRTNLPLLVGGDSRKPIKKLLLCYNGGERSQKALAWAKQLQSRGGIDALALVVQEDDGAHSAGVWAESIKSQLSQTRIKNFRLITRKGNPPDEIVKAAVKNESDLIVIGGYRHKPPLEWLTGSTADAVLRNTPLSVLIV